MYKFSKDELRKAIEDVSDKLWKYLFMQTNLPIEKYNNWYHRAYNKYYIQQDLEFLEDVKNAVFEIKRDTQSRMNKIAKWVGEQVDNIEE
jgi:hypothetical protein